MGSFADAVMMDSQVPSFLPRKRAFSAIDGCDPSEICAAGGFSASSPLAGVIVWMEVMVVARLCIY